MCAVVLVAFNSPKKDFSIRCGLTDNFNYNKKSSSLLFTHFGRTCAQTQANASLLRLQNHPVMQRQPSEGSQPSFVWCSSTISPFFLFSCGAQHLFTFGTTSHERCKLFFSLLFKTKHCCGLLSLQKQACVRCKL